MTHKSPDDDAKQVAYDEITKQLEALAFTLGGRIKDKDKDHLIKVGAYEHVRTRQRDIYWLKEQLREAWNYRAKAPRSQQLPSNTPQILELRAEVLASLAARMADQDPEVLQFRRQVLRTKFPLKEAEVHTWIHSIAKSEGLPTTFLSITIAEPAKARVGMSSHLKKSLRLPAGTQVTKSYHAVAYKVPGRSFVERVLVTAAGKLDQLFLMSKRLSRQCHWTEEDATVFILTGHSPSSVSMIESRGHFADPDEEVLVDEPQLGSKRHRVVIDSDISVPPAVVAREYTRHRAGILAELNKRRGKMRNLTEKHLRLALFMQSYPVDEPWPDKFNEWNKQHPKWQYTNVANFKRDVRAAREHLFLYGRKPDEFFKYSSSS